MGKNNSRYIDIDGLRFRLGSLVYTKKTVVYNTGSAHDCQSDAQGFCDHSSICYGKKPEIIWSNVRRARERQGVMWRNSSADIFIEALRWMHKKYDVQRFRFNEVNDLNSQKDVDKMNTIADNVPQAVFGYIADFTLALKDAKFMFKISHDFDVEGSTGRAIVINTPAELPRGFILCPKTSHKIKQCDEGCGICYNGKHVDVALIKH